MRYPAAALLLTVVASGCVTQPRIVTPAEPPTIATPAPGTALIYFFRPSIDSTGSRAKPGLYLNGAKLADVAASSFVAVPVSAGEHTFELRPNDSFEREWATAAKFCAEANQVYFAAIWNQSQPPRGGSTAIMLPGGMFIPIPLGPSGLRGTVVFEPVDRELGRESLAGLTQAPVSQAASDSPQSPAPKCAGVA